MSTTPGPRPDPKLPDGFAPRILSFDVYGTLIDTPSATHAAFRAILADAGRTDIDPKAFYSHWERCNIKQYAGPYSAYKDIARRSLAQTYEAYGVTTGREEAIHRYFDIFGSFRLYPDVLPTLDLLSRRYGLALVSNIDDDLLDATTLGRAFDFVCTAERARGYKPDGTLFRHLLRTSGLQASEILHSGQSQFTDMVGGKPLGLTIAWINRRGLTLDPAVPAPDVILPSIEPLCGLLGLS